MGSALRRALRCDEHRPPGVYGARVARGPGIWSAGLALEAGRIDRSSAAEGTAVNDAAALPPVVDDAEHGRFLLRDGDSEAELIYHTRPGRLILVHTEVPDALGERGIGGHLVQAALDRAAATGETVVPMCPFARNWLQKHPEAMRGVTVEMRDDG